MRAELAIISFTSRRHCSRSWPAQFRKSLRNNKSARILACTATERSSYPADSNYPGTCTRIHRPLDHETIPSLATLRNRTGHLLSRKLETNVLPSDYDKREYSGEMILCVTRIENRWHGVHRWSSDRKVCEILSSEKRKGFLPQRRNKF